MKSFMAKKDQVEQKWLLVDAEGSILGRMAAKIAPMLMGKNKPTYTPHVDTGDYVIVVNAEKVRVTGKKAETKEYDYYTHHQGMDVLVGERTGRTFRLGDRVEAEVVRADRRQRQVDLVLQPAAGPRTGRHAHHGQAPKNGANRRGR